MRDPTTNLGVEELTELAIQYLCERDWREMCDEIDANRAICRDFTRRESIPWDWQPPARKRGRPSQRNRHLQIAGAVAMLREEAGVHPTRSHLGRQRWRGPSGCSIVAAALKQAGERPTSMPASSERFVILDERTVEGIWNRYRRSALINHPAVRDYIRNFRRLFSTITVPNNSVNC